MPKAIAVARLHDGNVWLHRIQKGLCGRRRAAVMRYQQPIGLKGLSALQQILLLRGFDVASE